MDIRQADYFIVLAEEKNISKAAERLFISQPALSQQLSQLENRLGAQLFVRGSGELQLTEAGRIYLNCAYNIRHIRLGAMKEIAALSQQAELPLAIGLDCCLSPKAVLRLSQLLLSLPSAPMFRLTTAPRSVLFSRLSAGNTSRAGQSAAEVPELHAVLACSPPSAQQPRLRSVQLLAEPCVVLFSDRLAGQVQIQCLNSLPYLHCALCPPAAPRLLSLPSPRLSLDRPELLPELLRRLDAFSILPQSAAPAPGNGFSTILLEQLVSSALLFCDPNADVPVLKELFCSLSGSSCLRPE